MRRARTSKDPTSASVDVQSYGSSRACSLTGVFCCKLDSVVTDSDCVVLLQVAARCCWRRQTEVFDSAEEASACYDV